MARLQTAVLCCIFAVAIGLPQNDDAIYEEEHRSALKHSSPSAFPTSRDELLQQSSLHDRKEAFHAGKARAYQTFARLCKKYRLRFCHKLHAKYAKKHATLAKHHAKKAKAIAAVMQQQLSTTQAAASASCNTGSCCRGQISSSDYGNLLGAQHRNTPKSEYSGKCVHSSANSAACSPCSNPWWPASPTYCKSNQVCKCSSFYNECVTVHEKKDEFLNIAHMVNTKTSVDWALKEGANALEIDIVFKGTTPFRVQHSVGQQECDCTCYMFLAAHTVTRLALHGNVCGVLRQKQGPLGCQAGEDVPDFLQHVSKKKLALLYFDNKVQAGWKDPEKEAAGAALANVIIKELFKNGYTGKILIGGGNVAFLKYLNAAKSVMDKAGYTAQVYYSFDDGSGTVENQIKNMQLLKTKNLMFSRGITSCLPMQFYEEMATAVEAKKKGLVKEVISWTIDSSSSMDKYIATGATGLLTNYPARLKYVVSKSGTKPAARK